MCGEMYRFLFVCFLVRSTLFDWLFVRLSDSFIHSLLAGWLIDHCVTNHFYSHVYACGLSILLSVNFFIFFNRKFLMIDVSVCETGRGPERLCTINKQGS